MNNSLRSIPAALVVAIACAAFPGAAVREARADSKVNFGISIGTRLPNGYVTIHVGREPYYYHRGVFYREGPRGYVVVAPPVVVARSAPKVVQQSEYESVWLGEVEYLFMDGAFFRRTPEGLVWQEAPLGAVTRQLPRDATSVWYHEIEYFEVDDTFFRKTPDGYRVVEAPWNRGGETAATSSAVKKS